MSVRSRRIRDRSWNAAPAALLVALAAAGPARAQQGPARVTAVPVEERTFRTRVSLLGEIEAVRQGRPAAEVEGLVEEVLVDEGTAVEAGQPLLRLSTEQRSILRRAAEAELRQTEEQLREYRAGSRPEEILQAEEAMNSAKALLDEADDAYRRVQSLFDKGTVPESDRITALARSQSTRHLWLERKAAFDLVKKGPRAETIARAEAAVAARRAELDRIEDEIRRAEVKAPFSGVITSKLVEKGDYVQRGAAVFAMVQIDPVRATLSAPESAVAIVRKGAELKVLVDALGGEELTGTVDAVVPEGDRLARTFPVKVLLDNPERRILPGMAARGILEIPAAAPALAVPTDAIVRTDAGAVLVYAVRDGRAALVPVALGAAEEGLVEVRGPLEAGEKVIVRGNERIFPDAPVAVLEGPAPKVEGPGGGP